MVVDPRTVAISVVLSALVSFFICKTVTRTLRHADAGDGVSARITTNLDAFGNTIVQNAGGGLETYSLKTLKSQLEASISSARLHAETKAAEAELNAKSHADTKSKEWGEWGRDQANASTDTKLANYVEKNTSYDFFTTNADKEACLTSHGEDRTIGDNNDDARWSTRDFERRCLTVKLS